MAKILIIDDDPDLVESMRVVLGSKGYDIVTASSGEEGLEKTKQNNPDLIILDIMMETVDKGFDVARKIKENQAYKDIPILMLTSIREKLGFDFRSEAGDDTWLPVDEYCEKPLNPEELINKVENLLKKRKGSD